jgi:regulator of protease activity HflC (stomatin/prohibitin superfamily)
MVGVLGVLVGVLVAVVLGSSVRRVPEGTVAVVERFGRYARTLRPGTALLLPMAERVRNRIDVREQTVPLRVVGTDAQGRPVVLQLRLRYKVVDPRAATYGVSAPGPALVQLLDVAARDAVAAEPADQLRRHLQPVADRLLALLKESGRGWGVRVDEVFVDEVSG